MSAPVMVPGLETLDLESLAPPCDCHKPGDDYSPEMCPHAAQWVARSRCCGVIFLLCDWHKQYLDPDDQDTICSGCQTITPPGVSPYASVERL